MRWRQKSTRVRTSRTTAVAAPAAWRRARSSASAARSSRWSPPIFSASIRALVMGLLSGGGRRRRAKRPSRPARPPTRAASSSPRVLGDTEDTWSADLPAGAARQYPAARRSCCLEQGINTGCGSATSAVGPVLLPCRPQGVHRPRVLQRSSRREFARAGRFREGLRASRTKSGTTCRPCSARPTRCARRSSRPRVRAERESACRCAWSCRRTATPASGRTTRTARGSSSRRGDIDEALGAAARGRRRHDPAPHPGQRAPGIFHARLRRAAPGVVPQGLRVRTSRQLQHVQMNSGGARQPVATGGCQCGAIRYAFYAPLENAHVCHCRMCQRATGGVFAALAGSRARRISHGRAAAPPSSRAPISRSARSARPAARRSRSSTTRRKRACT